MLLNIHVQWRMKGGLTVKCHGSGVGSGRRKGLGTSLMPPVPCASSYAGFFDLVHVACTSARWSCFWGRHTVQVWNFIGRDGVVISWWERVKTHCARWGSACLCPGFLAWAYKACARISSCTRLRNAMCCSAVLPPLCSVSLGRSDLGSWPVVPQGGGLGVLGKLLAVWE